LCLKKEADLGFFAQEPENVADDHREHIINNLSDEDILLPDSPQIPGQNTPKPSTFESFIW
jgi:hypothetical protein